MKALMNIKCFVFLFVHLLSFSWETHEHYRNMFAPQHGPITSFDKTVIICQNSWQRKDEEKYKSWNFMNGQLFLPFISQADEFLCLKVFIRVNSSKCCFEFLWKRVKKGERPSWNGNKLKQFAVNYFSTIRVDNFIKLNFPKNYHIKENSLFKHILQKIIFLPLAIIQKMLIGSAAINVIHIFILNQFSDWNHRTWSYACHAVANVVVSYAVKKHNFQQNCLIL